jgi:hypothetical protein
MNTIENENVKGLALRITALQAAGRSGFARAIHLTDYPSFSIPPSVLHLRKTYTAVIKNRRAGLAEMREVAVK